MPKTKLAFLIAAHGQPEHLARLIRALRDEQMYFFVHVDAKSAIEPFEFLSHEPNVSLVARREKVVWGGYSLTRATLSLMEAAIDSGNHFVRYTLLSGADFPIKSRKEIGEALRRDDYEFIRIDRRLTDTVRRDLAARVERFHWSDAWYLDRESIEHRWLRFAHSRSLALANRVLSPRRMPLGLAPYHGSGWWSLTDGCVRFILDFLNRNPRYVRFHRWVHVPDEVFFHTIVKVSPFARMIAHDFELGTAVGNDHARHYIDWHAIGVKLPKVLDETDLTALLSSGALFARKFDEVQSRGLVDILEKRLSDADQ